MGLGYRNRLYNYHILRCFYHDIFEKCCHSRGLLYLYVCTSVTYVAFIAAFGQFGLVAGGFKSLGVIMVELIDRFPEYDPATLLWVFSINFFIAAAIGS